MSNAFDQFDAPVAPANPFDQFDGTPPTSTVATAAPEVVNHPTAGPSGSLATDIPVRLGSAGTNFLAQAASLPRTVAQGVDWVGNKVGVNPGADEALASVAPMGVQMFPDYASAKDRAYQMTGATEYVPETMGGRMVQAGLEAAPYGLAGTGKQIIQQFLPNIVGAATGEGAAEMVPNHPVLARVFGYLTGAKAASGVANTTTKAVGMATGTAPTTQLYRDYVTEGVPTNLAGDVTQNRGLQFMQSMAAKLPGGAEKMANEAEQARTAWDASVERNAAKLGPSATKEDAGQALQTAAKQWLGDWKMNSNANWSAFRQAVPATTPISVSNFATTLRDVNQQFGSANALADALQPALGSKLADALAKDASTGTLPWQAVQATRTRLGEMLQGAPVADMSQSAIKQLYGALTQDMEAGANAAGRPAARAFNKANAYTAFGHTLLEDHLNPILTANTPEQAAQYALAHVRMGGTRLSAINSPLTMPGQAEDLGAATLRQAAEDGPTKLASELRKMAPEARAQLFGSNAVGVGRVENIASSMGSSARLMGNPSGTAPHMQGSGLARLIQAVELGRMGNDLAGGAGRAVGTAMGLFAPEIMGKTAAAIGANPLLARIYATDLGPFAAPTLTSPNALSELTMPDRRRTAGGTRANPLLSGR